MLCLFLVLWASLFLPPCPSISTFLFFCHCLPSPFSPPFLLAYLPFFSVTLVSLPLVLWFCLFSTGRWKGSVWCPSPECSIPPMASLYANIWNSGRVSVLLCQFSMTPLHFRGTEILLCASSSFVFFLAVLIQMWLFGLYPKERVEKAQIKLKRLKMEIGNKAQLLSQWEGLLRVWAKQCHLFYSVKHFQIFSVSALSCLTSLWCFWCYTSYSNTTDFTTTTSGYFSWFTL